MNRSRIMTVAAVLVIGAVLALGWFLGVDPQLAQARTADADRAGVEEVNRAYEAKLVELKELDKRLPQLETELATLSRSIPSDADISTLLGELNAIATSSGVQITSIRADIPAAFAGKGEVIPATDPGDPGAPVTETTTAAETTTVGSTGMVSIPISVSVRGERDATLLFTQLVQSGNRLYLVTELDVVIAGELTTTTLEGLVYVLPDRRAALESNE